MPRPFDFGFSLVDENELKAREADLEQQVNSKATEASKHAAKAAAMQTKLEALYGLVMPLLENLSTDPEKTHVLWPNRAAEMKEFILEVDTYVYGKSKH